jgi:DNA-binding transcriptional regulator YhcF (GntR family)
MQNKNKELDRLNGVYMKLLNNAGVKYIEGRGTVVDAHTVEVDGKQYTVSHTEVSHVAAHMQCCHAHRLQGPALLLHCYKEWSGYAS